MTVDTKICSKCGNNKPLTEYYKDKRASDSLMSQCSTCNRLYRQKTVGKFDHLKDIPAEPDGMRYCTHCGTIKTLDEFQKYKKRNKYIYRRICTECKRAQAREYVTENKDTIKEYREANPDIMKRGYKRFHKKNPKYASLQSKVRRKEKPEIVKQEIKRWQNNNRDKYLTAKTAREARRRARKQKLPNTLTAQEWRYCINYFNNQCLTCGSTYKIVCDHWIPLSDSNCPGTTAHNSMILCSSCNSSKGGTLAGERLRKKFTEIQALMIEDIVREYFNSL